MRADGAPLGAPDGARPRPRRLLSQSPHWSRCPIPSPQRRGGSVVARCCVCAARGGRGARLRASVAARPFLAATALPQQSEAMIPRGARVEPCAPIGARPCPRVVCSSPCPVFVGVYPSPPRGMGAAGTCPRRPCLTRAASRRGAAAAMPPCAKSLQTQGASRASAALVSSAPCVYMGCFARCGARVHPAAAAAFV